MLQNETRPAGKPLAQRPELRWQNMLASGDPRALARQCTAKSKQTGQRCRNPARKGYRVCGYHGVSRFDRITPEIAERRARAVAIKGTQETLESAVQQAQLLPETLQVFQRQFAGRVPSHLEALFLLKLDARLRGNLSRTVWQRALRGLLS